MGLHWKDWNRNDVIYAIIAPILVVLLIVLISKLSALFGGGFGVVLELQWS
jgi:cytochrome c oxidase subunit IV